MNMEEALTVIQKIKDAWAAFGQSMAGAAQALEDMWPKRNGMPPKKYGMSLHRRVRPAPPRYQFVPVTPRNRPYQRRAF